MAIWGVILIICSHEQDVIRIGKWVNRDMPYESSEVLFILVESLN
jgi:hypothetical protein